MYVEKFQPRDMSGHFALVPKIKWRYELDLVPVDVELSHFVLLLMKLPEGITMILSDIVKRYIRELK